jgi:hypothetical protein
MDYVHDLKEKNIMFYSDDKYNIEDYRTVTVL